METSLFNRIEEMVERKDKFIIEMCYHLDYTWENAQHCPHFYAYVAQELKKREAEAKPSNNKGNTLLSVLVGLVLLGMTMHAMASMTIISTKLSNNARTKLDAKIQEAAALKLEIEQQGYARMCDATVEECPGTVIACVKDVANSKDFTYCEEGECTFNAEESRWQHSGTNCKEVLSK